VAGVDLGHAGVIGWIVEEASSSADEVDSADEEEKRGSASNDERIAERSFHFCLIGVIFFICSRTLSVAGAERSPPTQYGAAMPTDFRRLGLPVTKVGN
jgi:hypothetical protein